MVAYRANGTGVVVVNARGPARANDLAYARRKIDSVQRLALEPARSAKVDLVVQPALAGEPVAAHAELHFASAVVRAYAAAATVAEAVDLLATRLRHELRRAAVA